MVLPLEARMHAAFHLAYCVSCNQKEEMVVTTAAAGRRSVHGADMGGPYIVTFYVDLVHPVCYRKQELYSKFLVCHIDIRHDLTA